MIAITNHAYSRACERYGFKNRKDVIKQAKKAWISKEEISESFKKSKYYLNRMGFTTYTYKQLKKIIYVFQDHGEDMVLITIYRK